MRLKNNWIVLVCVFASTATAQVGGYLGPGVLSSGAGTIGQRSGADVDLRFHADVSGLYDSGISPFAVDSTGHLVQLNGLYGEQVSLGAYGTHQWKQAALGLDYSGNFYHYENASSYDGSSQNLRLGVSYQKSRRLVFDFRQIAGLTTYAYGSPGFYSGTVPAAGEVVNQPTSLLFDNRMFYLQSTVAANYLQSSRTIYTIGGDWYTMQRNTSEIASVDGYTFQGRITHRVSRARSIGVTYDYIHYQFKPLFGSADVHAGEGFFGGSLGRRWTFSVHGGAFFSEVSGVEQVAVDPVIAALLGQSSFTRAFYRTQISPSGGASLAVKFQRSNLIFFYNRSVSPGNGIYLTSQVSNATVSYSYTGIRNWNLGLSGGYSTLSAIGQGLQPYSQLIGGAGFTYRLSRLFHIVGRYDARHQEINLVGYRQTGYRVMLGLSLSPGDIPLSLW